MLVNEYNYFGEYFKIGNKVEYALPIEKYNHLAGEKGIITSLEVIDNYLKVSAKFSDELIIKDNVDSFIAL